VHDDAVTRNRPSRGAAVPGIVGELEVQKMGFKRIDHVGIVVSDLERANAFMRDVLGLSEAKIAEPGLASTRTFWRIGNVDIQVIQDRDRLGSASTGRIEHIAFEVDDVVEAVSQLEASGWEMQTDEPIEVRGGHGRTILTTESGPLGIMFQLSDGEID